MMKKRAQINIDDAIQRCYNVASKNGQENSEEHLQLAAWLEELKDLRAASLKQKSEIARLQHILVSFIDEVSLWGNKYNIDTSNIPKLVLLGEEQENILTQMKSAHMNEIESLNRRLNNSQLHQKNTYKLLQESRNLHLKEDYIRLEAVKDFWFNLKTHCSTLDKRLISVEFGDNLIAQMEKSNNGE